MHQLLFKRNQENVIQAEIKAILHTQVEEQLAQLQGVGPAPPVPMPILANFISGGLWSLIHWWHEQDFPYTPEEMDAFFQQIAMTGTLSLLGKSESDLPAGS